MLSEVSGFPKNLKLPWSEKNRKIPKNKLSKAKLVAENFEFSRGELSRLEFPWSEKNRKIP